MSGRNLAALATTAVAPCLWGTGYVVFTKFLPVEHPLLAATLRALPAGLVLMAFGAGLPSRDKLPRLATLGMLNIGLFFGLIFLGAARLPTSLAATLGSTQPLIVAFLAWPLLQRRPNAIQIIAALAGLGGIALLLFDPGAKLDLLGALACLGSAISMSLGTVLNERWGNMGTALQLATWQLALGGIVLLPLALAIEGLPPIPTVTNVLAVFYLSAFCTALAFWLWVRGIGLIGSNSSFLLLLSPLVATLISAAILDEQLHLSQWVGVAVILGATYFGLRAAQKQRGASIPQR